MARFPDIPPRAAADQRSRSGLPESNDRLLSQLAAGQWWGYQVLPATASDVWITDGLSRYAEAMYAEESGGVAALQQGA